MRLKQSKPLIGQCIFLLILFDFSLAYLHNSDSDGDERVIPSSLPKRIPGNKPTPNIRDVAFDKLRRSLWIPGCPKEGFPSTGPIFGSRSVLVVRVVSKFKLDGKFGPISITVRPKRTKKQLSDDVFGRNGDTVNLVNQIEKCSLEKLVIKQAGNRSKQNSIVKIKDGVAEIVVDINPSGAPWKTFAQAIMAESTRQKLWSCQRNTRPYDYVFFALPHGTEMSTEDFDEDTPWFEKWLYANFWTALAQPSYGVAFFNDAFLYRQNYIQYDSYQIHEFGHLLGLAHSSYENNAYGDSSGYMGGSPQRDNISRCFNPVKSWQLGWYSENEAYVDPLEKNFVTDCVDMVGVDDLYKNKSRLSSVIVVPKLALSSAIVVLRVAQESNRDIYLMYNRKKGINRSTATCKNMIVIVKQLVEGGNLGDHSKLIRCLRAGQDFILPDNNGRVYVEESFRENKSQLMRVCVSSCTSDCGESAECDSEGKCVCKTGFTGTYPNCKDIDECNTGSNRCPAYNEKCKNIPGSFICECTKGFIGIPPCSCFGTVCANGDCVVPDSSTCPEECGDGICDEGESMSSCPEDCPVSKEPTESPEPITQPSSSPSPISSSPSEQLPSVSSSQPSSSEQTPTDGTFPFPGDRPCVNSINIGDEYNNMCSEMGLPPYAARRELIGEALCCHFTFYSYPEHMNDYCINFGCRRGIYDNTCAPFSGCCTTSHYGQDCACAQNCVYYPNDCPPPCVFMWGRGCYDIEKGPKGTCT